MDPQAHGYIVVAFHRRVRVSSFICVPKDGSDKGIVLNINHNIVPQAIGNTLIGVSLGKVGLVRTFYLTPVGLIASSSSLAVEGQNGL